MITIRRATDIDAAESARLSYEAFGYRIEDPTTALPLCSDAQIMYLACDDAGRVVGKCRDRHYWSWFGGREVATAGVASVTVEPEARGQGVMRALMTALLVGARERGAVISCLTPTVPAAYRKFGYETICTYDYLRIPTVLLSHTPMPQGVRLRRGSSVDFAPMLACYTRWAREQNGPLTRTGPSFPVDAAELDKFSITLAEDESGLVGYSMWQRDKGYHNDSELKVADLIGCTRPAIMALVSALGASYQVAPTTLLETSGLDQLRMVLGDRLHAVVDQEDYMCAILDVERALTERDYPTTVAGQTEFGVRGSLVPGLDGCYRFTVANGAGACVKIPDGAGTCVKIPDDSTVPTFTAGGLAALYAGAQSTANLTMLDLMDAAPDANLWDACFGGRQVHIRDSY